MLPDLFGMSEPSTEQSAGAPQQLSGLYAQVVPEQGIDVPDGYDYALPEHLASVTAGHRVRVPLGGKKAAQGVVIGVSDTTDVPAKKVKAVLEDLGGAFSPLLVQLARWIANYYCCPLGMVFATMQPAAVKKAIGQRAKTFIEPTGAVPARTVKSGKLTPSVQAAWDAFEQLSARLPAEEQGGAKPFFPIEPKVLMGELGLKTLGPINRLVERGLLREVQRAVVRTFGEQSSFTLTPDTPPALTDQQQNAVDGVVRTLGTFAPHLLFGVTGAGKTEVYLRVIDEVIKGGKSAIVLVPEIALTPQTAQRFMQRFQARDRDPVGVAVLHSGLTASQRNHEWARVRSGEARVVVGARSAVFAPFGVGGSPSVGIVVVDEEHDSSYKQDQLPRYHARDVALRRAQLEGCPVLLGSATPSLESWHNATSTGPSGKTRFNLIELTERVGGGRLPKVEVVDMREQTQLQVELDKQRGVQNRRKTIGPALGEALADTLDRGDQAILLLNRRGYAGRVMCPSSSCGWFLECNSCSAAMVLHKKDAGGGSYVRCHHCLAQQRVPEVCPMCGKKWVLWHDGTQRLEEELARDHPVLEPGKTLLRLDADTMRTGRDYFESLEKFRRGEARVLMGTQMLAKGLDFPGVGLIGVVNADTALSVPDFRASERTFQLVAQVAGRAGRSEETAASARVIVQTLFPHAPAVTSAAEHDFVSFAQAELVDRVRTSLPPAGRMARLVFRDEDRDKARDAAEAVRGAVEHLCAQEVQVFESLRVTTAMPCPIERVADHYRFEVRLHAPTAGVIARGLGQLRKQGLVKSDAHTAVDVDPVSLL